MKFKQYRWIALLFCVAFVLVGCASFTTNNYKALGISYYTYDKTFTVLNELYQEGKITEEQKQKSIELGNVYMIAHNEAVKALGTYERMGGMENKDYALVAMAAYSKAWAEFIAFVRPLIDKEEK